MHYNTKIKTTLKYRVTTVTRRKMLVDKWVKYPKVILLPSLNTLASFVFTCVSSHADARLRYSNSVRPSACPSHACIVSKRLNILSCFLHHTIAIHSSFVCIQDLREIPTGSPPAGALNKGGVWKCRNFWPINCYSQKWLKIDGYMQRGVLQALNPNRVTFTAIVAGAYQGEAKMCISP